MRTDTELRREVERELESDPGVDGRRIGVAVVDGVVTLAGEVTTYSEKWKAEKAAWAAPGVKEVRNLLTVHVPAYAT